MKQNIASAGNHGSLLGVSDLPKKLDLA